MSFSGMCVALSAALVYDKKTVVLSILGTYFNGIVLDHFIFDHNIKAQSLRYHGQGRRTSQIHYRGFTTVEQRFMKLHKCPYKLLNAFKC